MTARADWLTWRRGGLGGSDLPAVLGISPWSSPFAVWVDKVGLLPAEDDETDFMEFGRWAELMIGPWFASRTGLTVAGEQTWCSHPGEPWQRCTVDGFVLDDPDACLADARGLMQIKTTAPGRRWEEIPAHIQAQEQWEMHVTGLDHVWLPVLHGRRLEVYELERDQDDIDMMIDRARSFWFDNVLAQQPPPIDGSDATERALKALYPEATPGKSIELDPDQWTDLRQLGNAKVTERAAAAQAKELTNRIRAAMGDAYEGTIGGRRAVTLGTQTRKTTCPDCGAVRESAPFRVLRPIKEFA